MNYSNNYIFYPDNLELVKALQYFVGRLEDYDPEDIRPDSQVTVADNFANTRGNYEQHQYRGTLLDPAREVLEAELTDALRQQSPLQWAQLQNHLGNILGALGQQHHDAELYAGAIAAFEAALEVLSQEETPLEWATSQYNLGTASQAVGRQEDDSKLLKQGVDAYTNALLVWNQNDTPEQWGRCMHQLGNTFHAHGLLLKGNRTLQKSVVSYKNALKVFNADDHALELAAAHMNCGAVLHHLAESEENADRMLEAIQSYETGHLVCMEQQLPIHLSVVGRINISTARGRHAEMTSNARVADDAADEFEVILEAFGNSCQPLAVKHCEAQRDHLRGLVDSLASN